METIVLNKVHDESKQGEAFAPLVETTENSKKKYYIESYGCAMNFADSEIVASILNGEGFGATRNFEDADIVLVNTCSIREKAEATVRKRLTEFRKVKQSKPGMLVGILGCMAERLKEKLLEEEKLVDLVIGPDAYRALPLLIEEAESGQKAVNVLLSREETYADISPVRLNSNGVTAFVSIMRGCNNMCSFCVVPFTRGRERSRDAFSIVKECEDLFNEGYREITLLGQNVDSYNFAPPPPKGGIEESNSSSFGGVGEAFPSGGGGVVTFANLLEKVALINPLLRVRFSTSHPKDITDDVLHVMAKYENVCKHIHLPVQSGSSRVLQLMNRTYTREWYMAKVDRISELLPECSLTSDFITGFCTETEEDHLETLSIIQYGKFDMSYMYFYSERPGTLAARRFTDDIPLDVKKRRLDEIVKLQNKLSQASYKGDIGKTFKVLIEGNSKRSELDWAGKNSQNKVIVFPKLNYEYSKGDYLMVHITSATGATLIGEIVGNYANETAAASSVADEVIATQG